MGGGAVCDFYPVIRIALAMRGRGVGACGCLWRQPGQAGRTFQG
jgi:hypothetical protein